MIEPVRAKALRLASFAAGVDDRGARALARWILGWLDGEATQAAPPSAPVLEVEESAAAAKTARVAAYRIAHPEASSRTIAAELGLSRGAVLRALDALGADREVDREVDRDPRTDPDRDPLASGSDAGSRSGSRAISPSGSFSEISPENKEIQRESAGAREDRSADRSVDRSTDRSTSDVPSDPPETIEITEAIRAACVMAGAPEPTAEDAIQCLIHARAEGRRYADWGARLVQWQVRKRVRDSGVRRAAPALGASLQPVLEAYERGIAAGKGGAFAVARPVSSADAEALETAVRTHARKRKTGAPIEGPDLLGWVAAAAEDFAAWVVQQADPRTPAFYASFGPRGFARWMNEVETRRATK